MVLHSNGPHIQVNLIKLTVVLGRQFYCAISADCKTGVWTPWSKCSVTCGGGTKTRTRNVVQNSQNGGASCPTLKETMNCKTDKCKEIAIPSSWASWGSWSTCNKCGIKKQRRSRSCNLAQNGGSTSICRSSESWTRICRIRCRCICSGRCIMSHSQSWQQSSASTRGASGTLTRYKLNKGCHAKKSHQGRRCKNTIQCLETKDAVADSANLE